MFLALTQMLLSLILMRNSKTCWDIFRKILKVESLLKIWFGGYGSFLSMYQRSPVCSRPKTLPEVQQNQVGGRSNCSASSVIPQVSVSGSASKAPASDVLVKFKKFVNSSNIGTPDSKQISDTKTSGSASSNHKTLRLRIKVGSSDLSSLKNVSTFSKEGLNMPPSGGSRVNYLSEVEEDLLNGICHSPTKILMAMVSFPLHKDQLLSPLSDDLLQLGKREKITKDARYGSVNKSDSNSTQDFMGVSESQKRAGKFSIGKKQKKERVKYMPPSNKLDRNHIVSNTEKEADKDSCEELVSKTMKLPLLSCLSPSYIHPAKEIDKVSDYNVEGTSRGTNNSDQDATLMDSKPDLKDNVVAFSDRSVKETESIYAREDVYLKIGEPLNPLESKSKRENTSSTEHVDYSSVVKGSQSETRNEEQILKSKLPKAQKPQKCSSSIVAMGSLRGEDAAVNIIKKNVPDILQEDIGGCKHVNKGGYSKESKEEKQSSPVPKAEKEKLSAENASEENFNSVKNDEEGCDHLNLLCEPDLKHPIKLRDLNEDRHNNKQSVRQQVKNKHSVEGGMESEKELSGTSKKPKTRRSRFSAVDQLGSKNSNKILDVLADNKTTIAQASAENIKDIAMASSHGERDDRKRKLKETKESGECMRIREATVMASSGESVRKKKRLKVSSCDEKELPFSSESCDKDRRVGQEIGRDSASHLPFTTSSPNLCKDLDSEITKYSVHEAKGSLVESVAPSALRVLDSRELKSGRISESDKYHDTDSNAGDTLKRCRDGEGYSTIDKPGTTKKAAENSEDRERAYGGNCSTENFKPKNSGRISGENCLQDDSQQKSREEGSSTPSKDNKWGTVNEVQDLGTAVKIKTKESRSKKRPAKEVSMESNREDSREYQDPNSKLDRSGSLFPSPQKPDTAKTSRGKSNHVEVTTEKLEKKSASPAGTDQVEVLGHGSEISNTKKQILRNENHSVTHSEGSRNQKQNGSRHKDYVGLSPLKKESTSQAVSNSIKEATDLKHMADRLKSAGSNHESTGVYFQAALKFLHGASLLESSGTARSRDIYGSTAKLCAFCAHEYEKNKDMGAAALAYKCMEVAYLRITCTSHGNIGRCRYELQAALQVIPSGESPSFASDGENSNHILAAEKVALSNTVRSSPSVTGNHVISSGNNSSLSQLLAFSQHVNAAMDASRKAQIAFAAAKGKSKYSNDDGITSIKKALDLNFQDMEKLLHVVRLAMESINR
ncbi:PREDICTED: uncharacterized protein LOC104760233 isoform X2 [Camelina sativa]|uniref:Uncharacterized protein LOC104760233 isoform X2 n=1 Tax=Camelina sativa TaxID=90675 RepID=A0ABM0X6E5_CAMSA|nr:PREDICTED: uncharacterized protein LOC104760233 isoform X2 [Camelina sativa]